MNALSGGQDKEKKNKAKDVKIYYSSSDSDYDPKYDPEYDSSSDSSSDFDYPDKKGSFRKKRKKYSSSSSDEEEYDDSSSDDEENGLLFRLERRNEMERKGGRHYSNGMSNNGIVTINTFKNNKKNYVMDNHNLEYEETKLRTEFVVPFELAKKKICNGDVVKVRIPGVFFKQAIVKYLQSTQLSCYRNSDDIPVQQRCLLNKWMPNKICIMDVFCDNAPNCRFGVSINSNNNNDIYNNCHHFSNSDNYETPRSILFSHSPSRNYPINLDYTHVLKQKGFGDFMMTGVEMKKAHCNLYTDKQIINSTEPYYNVKIGTKIYNVLKENCEDYDNYCRQVNFKEDSSNGYLHCIPESIINKCVQKIDKSLENKTVNYDICEEGIEFILEPLHQNTYFDIEQELSYNENTNARIEVRFVMCLCQPVPC